MAVKDKKMVNPYKSDLGVTFSYVPFTITSKLDDCIAYPDRLPKCSCPIPFKMRALVATFSPANNAKKECLVVRFPVPDTDTDMVDSVRRLKACGAICIDLDGEEWDVIPPTLTADIKYTPTYDLIKLEEAGNFSPKYSGRMDLYETDLGVGDFSFKPKVAIEVDPVDLAEKILGKRPARDPVSNLYVPDGNEAGCTGPIVKQTICSLSDFSARYLTIRGNSTYDGISDEQKKEPRIFSRKIPVKAIADIATCVQSVSAFKGIQCFGYKGESIRRIDLLVPDA